MKYIASLLLFITLAASVFAARATITFDGNNPAGSVEYFVEQREGANWVEKVKGNASPLSYDLGTAKPGDSIVVRVRARLPNGTGVTAPSNEATATVPANIPGNLRIEIVVTVTATATN